MHSRHLQVVSSGISEVYEGDRDAFSSHTLTCGTLTHRILACFIGGAPEEYMDVTEVRALLRVLRPCWHSCHSRATSASSASPTSGVTPPLLSGPGSDPFSSDIWK